LDYYRQNAPEKMKLVNDALMAKWDGKYEELYAGITKKYGPIGHPIPQAAKAPPARRGSVDKNGKKTVADYYETFVSMVAQATPAPPAERVVSVVDAKAANELNGLETSSFTLCTRIRPILSHEEGREKEEYFTCVVPGKVCNSKDGKDHTEEALVLQPKISVSGKPTLDNKAFKMDYCFGPDSENEDIYTSIGAPLVRRAKEGQVGVIFAYGQTGSGKTHTMNGILNGVVQDLFADESAPRAIDFSYFEVLGPHLADCLTADGPDLKIGELLDGSIATINLSEHAVSNPDQLSKLVRIAQEKRSTAATEMNDTSSRSHGVAIIRVRMGPNPIP